jgi:hypothetical protein
VGSINYIELDKEISVYHINNIKNGMSPSFSIHFKNGIPPEEERNRIRMDIERQLSGASNAGKFIVTYSDDPDRKPDFEPFQLSDAHNQYQFLSEEVTAKIMVGHRVTSPQMFGVAVPGKLGGGGELAEASELFERNVIAPARQVVTEAVKTLLNASGLDSQLITLSSEEINLTEAFNHLMECGEEINEEEWELIDARKVDYEKEGEQDAIWKVASVIDFEPNVDSEQDNEIIKVRYAYMPKVTGTPDGESRDFCQMMVGAGNRVWKKEDIEAASGANPGWGPNGAARYSIWLYKGGGSCQHFWERRTFLQKDNKRVSISEARKLLREAGLDPIERNEPEVAKRPRDMKNRGFLEPKNWTTPR